MLQETHAKQGWLISQERKSGKWREGEKKREKERDERLRGCC